MFKTNCVILFIICTNALGCSVLTLSLNLRANSIIELESANVKVFFSDNMALTSEIFDRADSNQMAAPPAIVVYCGMHENAS